jgi:hypothetical protein
MSLRALFILLCVGVSAGSHACADWTATMRRVTYPPDFRYIERSQLKSAMWRLAYDVRELDQLMRMPPPVDASRRDATERYLNDLLVATDALRGGGQPTNHPLLTDHLGRFRLDVSLALAAVEAEPPSYYLVGSVTGACLTCHGAGT